MKRRYKLFITLLPLACLFAVLAHSIDTEVSPQAIASEQTIQRAVPVSTVHKRRFSLTKQEELSRHLACEPYGAFSAEIIGRATESNGEELVLWKFTKSPPGNTDVSGHFFIRVTTLIGGSSVCGTAYDPFIDNAITDRIKLDAARSLSLQLHQYLVSEAGGIDNYRAEFLEELRNRRFYPYDISFTSIDVWVWEQIGLNIPRDQYDFIEDIDSNYRYDNNGPIGL